MSTDLSLAEFLALNQYWEWDDCYIRLDQITLGSDWEARLQMQSTPWWREGANPDQVGVFGVVLRGIVDCQLPLGFWFGDLAVWHLGLQGSGHAVMEHGPAGVIYGASPLPDPDQFFAEFTDLLISLNAQQGPLDYLRRGTVAEFRSVVSSPGYMLMEAPSPVIQATRPMLEARSVRYSCLPQAGKDRDGTVGRPLIEVEINDGWVLCQEARVTLAG
ncbi:hypothetical protein HHL28_05710 [Aerophototrophica crusticola]|uniref:Uncharacterized protein n=1 Tax=Aerophototrophica crusticola TaxID=1709002 RepID=A0A858R5T5_9PROT|nr:hypothetical protein HHL28_05710 [Rhodospirillaceae bacterium B3]